MGGFSHGMRQRVKLAQALAHEPDLLLLDEPLNGLDPAQRREIIEVLHRLGDEGRTVIVSSHVLHEVERMAPQVLVLVNGHLVAEGQTTRDPPADQRAAADDPRCRGRRRPPARRRARRHGVVDAVRFQDGTLEFETGDVERFSRALPALAQAHGHDHPAGRARRRRPRERLRLPARARAGSRPVIIGPVYRLTLRALLLQRRTILLALLAAAPVLMAFVYAVAASAGADHLEFYSHLVQELFVPTIAAVVALVIGVSAIGDEREDGTIFYLVATPQSRLGLIATKIAAAWTATLVLLVPSLVHLGAPHPEGRRPTCRRWRGRSRASRSRRWRTAASRPGSRFGRAGRS